MHPRLFEIPKLFEIGGVAVGPFTVYTYGVLLAAAYLIGLQLALVRAKHRGLDPARMLDLGVYIIIAALVGAKLLLLVTEFDTYRGNPAELISLLRAGGVFYGGLIGAVLVAFWYIARHRLPVWTTCDLFAPGIALGHVVGRVGCLMAGCCWGRETALPWGVTFTDPFSHTLVGTPLGVPLHPTQLYEAGTELLILGLLLATERKGRPFPGRTFWGYLLLYAVSRFVIEFFRDDPRGVVLGVSTSQFISLVLGPLSIVMLVVLARRSGKAAPARAQRRTG
jgi:phosphatidylglycerol---prolipoprotein diacylglyceryl transferase